MSKELDRLNLHRGILTGKLALAQRMACNEATQASLRAHLGRVEAQIDRILHPTPRLSKEER